MPRIPLLCLSLAWVLATLAGPVQAQTRPLEKLTLILDWFVNPDHAPLVVAYEKGYFREAGLDVEIIAPADPSDPPKLVAAGRADVAISYQPQLTIQVDQGLPLTRIGTLVATPLTCLAVLADSPIASIADLKGRKIGYSVGGVEDGILSVMLAKAGLGLKDVTMVNVNFSLSPALITRQVDAVIGAFRNFELNQLAIEGHPGRCFYVEEEGVPIFDELVLVVNRDKRDDPRYGRFIDAAERGTVYVLNHPDEAFKLFIAHHKELDDELNRRAFADTLRRFSPSPSALDRTRYDRFADFLKSQGLIKSIPALDTYAVQLKR
jgi:putative hydroxymethylpyrimidine transport system substrate-binding protein